MILEGLIKGKLLKRYKRFFVDCELEDGEIVTAHCANTGSMKSLLDEGNEVWIQENPNPKAKLKYKLQIMRTKTGALCCVNTMLPNKIVFEGIENGSIVELKDFTEIKSEVKYGEENSRIDVWTKDRDGAESFIEVKNTTLVEDELENVAQFPDSVTTRGAKHLRELAKEAVRGNRAVMVYLINREDGNKFRIANDIDPKYKEEFDLAKKEGLEVLPYKSKIVIDSKGNCEITVEEKVELIP